MNRGSGATTGKKRERVNPRGAIMSRLKSEGELKARKRKLRCVARVPEMKGLSAPINAIKP